MDLSAFFSNPNNLAWLIPIGPLLAFATITLITNKAKMVPGTSSEYTDHNHPAYPGIDVPMVANWSRAASVIVGLVGIGAAWLISLIVIGQATGLHELGHDILASSITWMDTGAGGFSLGTMVDPLTAAMLFMVPLACTMIFIYAVGYMAKDPRQARFFSMIALFAGAMLTLVVADNLLLLFVGWEVMGLCSYLLIGFWFEKESAYKAAVKAFITTRIADVIMLLGIAYLYAATGTLSFREIVYNTEVLEGLAAMPAIILPGLSAASLIAIFLIIGTVGKSAQFPLHVWLPDAMEGPTPVSAMIHAAAMVSAGIYMLIRMYPLLQAGGDAHHGVFTPPLLFMAIVGSITAIFAATIAVAQNDVKKVLAYSTISQLGFMVAALGIGAYVAAAFHLLTHAFFKALLFMASGAVIHGMEHGEHHVHAHGHGHDDEHDEVHVHTPALTAHAESAHHEGEHGDAHDTHNAHGAHDAGHDDAHHFDPQDMMNMGGLRRTMPVTFITFLIGGLSLSGLPFITAGFFSKDEILADAWYGITHGYGPHALVFILLALAAFLTAFYTMRQLGLTFWGEARSEAAKHANLGKGLVSFTMTLPLIVLAFFAVVAGYIGVHPDLPIFGAIFSPNGNPFHHFIGPTLAEEPGSIPFDWMPVLTSIAVGLGGLACGYLLYWRKPLVAGQRDPLIGILGEQMHTTLKNKYYIDAIYAAVFVRPALWFSKNVAYEFIDKGIIDGFLHLLARVFTWLGDFIKTLNMWLIDGVGDGIPELIARFGFWLRGIQSGRVQQYMLIITFVLLVLILIFALSTGVMQAAP
ncbi:MAG: putative NADH-quinone oxidoreductase subunit L [Chloroflexi bacterium OLB15]|nr:MAG: putative NADH-quinone oxidoreductase subunit L [Chloroflexi bacterium OLB15]